MEMKFGLATILAVILLVVIGALALDYFRLLRRLPRLGVVIALLGLATMLVVTVQAVIPTSQFFGEVVVQGESHRKVVALTFDDGPNPPYTDQMLDILKQHNVKATFFMVGSHVDLYPATARRIAMEGHAIGNHTYHHYDLLKLSHERVKEEIELCSKAIERATGVKTDLLRPPHGFRDTVVVEAANDKGMRLIEWSVMARDWKAPDAETIVKRTVKNVHNGAIILLHDGDGNLSSADRGLVTEALPALIVQLKALGYEFVTVPELLQTTRPLPRPMPVKDRM